MIFLFLVEVPGSTGPSSFEEMLALAAREFPPGSAEIPLAIRLARVAEPFLESAPGDLDQRLTMQLAVVAWNLARVPGSEDRENCLWEIAAELARGCGSGETGFAETLRGMADRKLELFPDDSEQITDCNVRRVGGRLRIEVKTSELAASVEKPARGGGRRGKGTGGKGRTARKTVLQLRVDLVDSDPPVWRRVLVPSDMTLDGLHYVIQDAMGWTNSHLHRFEVRGEGYADPRTDEFEEDRDEAELSVRRALPRAGSRVTYLYDFGDSWMHEIRLEKTLKTPGRSGARAPSCRDGAGCCPPEDIGGIWDYRDFLEALADPQHEDHESAVEWAPPDVDPAAFDREAADRAVREDLNRERTEAIEALFFGD